MIAVDTSSLVEFLGGTRGADVERVREAFRSGTAVLPPAVYAEILSDPRLPLQIEKLIVGIPVLDLKEGFWSRVGYLRKKVLKKGLKAKLADAIIAQSCIDNNVPLITRDRDFKNFQKVSDLQVFVGV